MRGSRIRRESLDEMKRALAGWGPDTATARALHVWVLSIVVFQQPTCVSANQECDRRQRPCSVQPTRGIANASTLSPASFSVGDLLPQN